MVSAVAAEAQKPKVEVFTVDNGLPSSEILDLAQDAAGRLWILSRGGVSVYDGSKFRTYTSADGLPPVELSALEIDPGGRVWVATRMPAVYFLEGKQWQPLPSPPEALGAQSVSSLAVGWRDGRPSVVIGTLEGDLAVWNGANWARPEALEGPALERISALLYDGEEIVVATGFGLCRLDGLALDCRERELDPRLREEIFAVGLRADQGAAPLDGARRLLLVGGDVDGILGG